MHVFPMTTIRYYTYGVYSFIDNLPNAMDDDEEEEVGMKSDLCGLLSLCFMFCEGNFGGGVVWTSYT